MTSAIVLLVMISAASAAYFEADTCCATNSACDKCSQVYNVNSISYCCPNCSGNVLVTALVCTCRFTYKDPSQAPTCVVSNKIVGDYPYWKPSYYFGTSNPVSTASSLLVFLLTTSIFICRHILHL